MGRLEDALDDWGIGRVLSGLWGPRAAQHQASVGGYSHLAQLVFLLLL